MIRFRHYLDACTPRVLILAALLAAYPNSLTAQKQPAIHKTPAAANKPISAAEFSKMVDLFSEPEGEFFSDNFTSNETAYLFVVDKLRELGVSGGAYIGVGPEQNFTYISKIRPQIAFIVDIRREAIIQHLMYKAVFHLSANRAQFLSHLLSRPLDQKGAPGPDSSIDDLVQYLNDARSSQESYDSNLEAIRKAIETDFQIALSARDQQLLERIYRAFRQASLGISFRLGTGLGGYGGFPTLGELLVATDLNGKEGNFLAAEKDYQFVRDLQERNRVIPVVGDFAGNKALATVGDYLRENGYTVSAFYTSNVEQFLFGDNLFGAFVENIRKLPINDRSVFIRAFRAGWQRHPAYIPGHRMITLLEKIGVFLNDYDAGLYPDYWSLGTTHFISGNPPRTTR